MLERTGERPQGDALPAPCCPQPFKSWAPGTWSRMVSALPCLKCKIKDYCCFNPLRLGMLLGFRKLEQTVRAGLSP